MLIIHRACPCHHVKPSTQLHRQSTAPSKSYVSLNCIAFKPFLHLCCRLGFSDAGVLAAGDSAGILCAQSAAFGGSWVPVFSSVAERKGSEWHWLTGFDEHNVFCVVCKSADVVPQVNHPNNVQVIQL